MKKWADILAAHEGFRRNVNTQEDAYEASLKYQDLVRELYSKRFRNLVTIQGMLAQGTLFAPERVAVALSPNQIKNYPFPIASPLDRLGPDDAPLIGGAAISNVLSRMAMDRELDVWVGRTAKVGRATPTAKAPPLPGQ